MGTPLEVFPLLLGLNLTPERWALYWAQWSPKTPFLSKISQGTSEVLHSVIETDGDIWKSHHGGLSTNTRHRWCILQAESNGTWWFERLYGLSTERNESKYFSKLSSRCSVMTIQHFCSELNFHFLTSMSALLDSWVYVGNIKYT